MLEQSFEHAQILLLSANLERSYFYEQSSEVMTSGRFKAPTAINWLINEISRKFQLFSPHYHPHTHSWDASPFTEAQRTQPGPLHNRTHPYMDGQDFMALIIEISRKFPLFSPHHRPPAHSRDASPFNEAQ